VKSYANGIRANFKGKSLETCQEQRDCKKQSPCFRVNSEEFRRLPFEFSGYKDTQRIYAAYQFFDIDNPTFSKDPKLVHAEQLKCTVEFYKAFNKNKRRCEFADVTAERSIKEKDFLDKYSKLYKYCRQCYLSTHWEVPDEFPFPEGIYNISSWTDFKVLLKERPYSFTPEIILPPELLYPWDSMRPEDVEILTEEPSVCTLDEKRMYDIILSLLTKPKKIPTPLDFVLTQTNTKKCLSSSDPAEIENLCRDYKKKGGNPLTSSSAATNYKYVNVTKWCDSGMNSTEHVAIRNKVWTAPSKYRDTIICNPNTLHKVWELNSYLKYMINHKGVGDYLDSADIKRFSQKHSLFILTDWKKSGLTMPHWYIKLVIKAIKEIADIDIDFPAEGWKIYDPEKDIWFQPSNFGYGLGMINNCYTLFNISLFEYAKELEIFTSEDEIVSFNDDSAIGCEEVSYNRWISVCKKSGGYLDLHKTFASKGVMFCEIHQFDNLKSNFKWVSAFHTLLSSFWKSYNYDHWRFLVSDMWDQIRGFNHDISREAAAYADGASTTMEVYIKTLSLAYWGKETNYLIPPELGGCGVGTTHRTAYMLKKGLTILENMCGDELVQAQNHLVVIKNSFSKHPQYRPWVKMPKGRTRSRMLQLGELSGLNHELDSLALKAHNMFLLDSEWYLKEFWGPLSTKLLRHQADLEINYDFYNWAKEQRWPTYSIPKFLVSKSIFVPERRILLFARMDKFPNKYSLPSMVEAFVTYESCENNIHVIPREEVSFKGYNLWEAPVVPESDYYAPIANMELISKISDFCDPRRCFLDYYHENSEIITELQTKDYRAEAALNLLKSIFREDFSEYVGATWYTTYPVPYRADQVELLSKQLPDMHDKILVDLNSEGTQEYEFPLDISFDYLDQDRRENKSFWKKKTSSKKRSVKKRMLDSGRTHPREPIEEDEPLSQVNMDDIREIMNRRILSSIRLKTDTQEEQTSDVQDEDVEINYDFSDFKRFDQGNIPDWVLQEPKSDSESEWDPEARSDDESMLIAQALDNFSEEDDESYVFERG
jgi:hypothetical protein